MEENPTAIDDSQKPPKARNAKEKKKMVKNPNKTRLGNSTYATKVLVLECWELLDRAIFY